VWRELSDYPDESVLLRPAVCGTWMVSWSIWWRWAQRRRVLDVPELGLARIVEYQRIRKCCIGRDVATTAAESSPCPRFADLPPLRREPEGVDDATTLLLGCQGCGWCVSIGLADGTRVVVTVEPAGRVCPSCGMSSVDEGAHGDLIEEAFRMGARRVRRRRTRRGTNPPGRTHSSTWGGSLFHWKIHSMVSSAGNSSPSVIEGVIRSASSRVIIC
jgi:hypothetical protein